MATILVLIFSMMATTEEKYKVTSTSLALLVRSCDHREGSKRTLVTGNVVRTYRCLHQIHRTLLRDECFSSAQITNQDGFFISRVKLSLDRYF